jgi:hypothetical protein
LELPDGSQLRKLLNQARDTLEKESAKARRLYQDFAMADAKQVDAIHALSLLRANFWIEPEDFQLPKGGISQAEALFCESKAEQKEIADQLSVFESAMQSRLIAALGLLKDPVVGKHLKDAQAVSREVSRLLPCLQAIKSIQHNLESLRRSLHGMGILLENLAGNESASELELQLHAHTTAMALDLAAIKTGLGQEAYPFGHHSTGDDLAGYAISNMPPNHDFSTYHLATEEVLGRCYALYFRILGRLALAAGRVEGVLGLGPLQIGGFD